MTVSMMIIMDRSTMAIGVMTASFIIRTAGMDFAATTETISATKELMASMAFTPVVTALGLVVVLAGSQVAAEDGEEVIAKAERIFGVSARRIDVQRCAAAPSSNTLSSGADVSED
jgi:hypothetical protein